MSPIKFEDLIKTQATGKKIKPVRKSKITKPKKKSDGIQMYLTDLDKNCGATSAEMTNLVKITNSRGGTFNTKIPVNGGHEYYVIQSFKTKDVMEMESSERWKVAKFWVKVMLDPRNEKNEEISDTVDKAVGLIMDKFMSDSD